MASGKTSRKTEKAKVEVQSKAKKAGTLKRPDIDAKDAVGFAKAKSRSQAPAPVRSGAVVQDSAAMVQTDVPKVMAVAAGSSDASSFVTDASEVNGRTLNGGGVDAHKQDSQSFAAHVNGSANRVSREAIAERAYFYWVERGFTHGAADEDWTRAETELSGT